MKLRFMEDPRNKNKVIVLDDKGRALGPADTSIFIAEINNELDRIKKELKPEHQAEKVAVIQEVVNKVSFDWEEQSKKQLSEMKQNLLDLEKEDAEARKNVREVTAEEVSILSYQANVLKSKWKLIATPGQYHDFMTELMESPAQVRQAFLDNAAEILTTENNYGQKLEVNEIKAITQQISTSLLTGEELEAAQQRETNISELNREYHQSLILDQAREAQFTSLKTIFNTDHYFNSNSDEKAFI